MKIIEHISDWQKLRATIPNTKTIGFVPTMGALHQGHASLIKESINNNDVTILCIFVNPTQFNDKGDFINYPNTIDHDIEIAKTLGVDYLLLPKQDEIYPDDYAYQVKTHDPLAHIMEGEFRLGHFDGMLTIVLKLLLLVRANRAYFGQKDYQQYKLVKSMVKSFFIETEIISCPTIREYQSNLALSSRNQRLNDKQRQLAQQFATIFHTHKDNPKLISEKLTDLGIDVEYIQQYENRLLGAIKIDDIRLIDNVEI
ncbi:pantoate--beta-alanine ligase [Thiotrichales bacterium 19S11-10]|nr:pantoate--beta-alanine ligase [Thiotrichales bacterium 19S11-10]